MCYNQLLKPSSFALVAWMLLTCAASISAQIKIGNNPGAINANSILEMESNNKGLLLPRLSLTSTTATNPLSTPVSNGMLVYNLNTVNDVSPGVYYYDGSKWIYMGSNLVLGELTGSGLVAQPKP